MTSVPGVQWYRDKFKYKTNNNKFVVITIIHKFKSPGSKHVLCFVLSCALGNNRGIIDLFDVYMSPTNNDVYIGYIMLLCIVYVYCQ